jgi:hypothetical protein
LDSKEDGLDASSAVKNIKPVAGRAMQEAGKISRTSLVRLGLIENRRSFLRRPSFYAAAGIITTMAFIIKEMFSPSSGE